MNNESDETTDSFDWSLTTWEGSRRLQMRQWAALPLERMIAALEEMQELAEKLAAQRPRKQAPTSTSDEFGPNDLHR